MRRGLVVGLAASSSSHFLCTLAHRLLFATASRTMPGCCTGRGPLRAGSRPSTGSESTSCDSRSTGVRLSHSAGHGLEPYRSGASRSAGSRRRRRRDALRHAALANGGRSTNWASTSSSTFASFAGAAARRYPWVKDLLIWNEPNQRRWPRPTTPSTYVTKLLHPAHRPATENALETGLFYAYCFTGDSSGSPRDGPDGGFVEPLGAVARRDPWSCRLRAAPQDETYQ